MSTENITTLREALFAQLRELREASGPDAIKLAIDKSKAVSELGQVLIGSAKVEIEYLKVTDARTGSGFIPDAPRITAGGTPPEGLPNGVTGITRHLLQG